MSNSGPHCQEMQHKWVIQVLHLTESSKTISPFFVKYNIKNFPKAYRNRKICNRHKSNYLISQLTN